MPLSVLLLLVTGGIAAIAILLHLLGMSKPRTFENNADVLAVWTAEYPDIPVTDCVISQNRQFALLRTRAGLGIVWPMGADGAARLLLGVEIADSPTGLDLSLPDYTAPQIRLRLHPTELPLWRRILETES